MKIVVIGSGAMGCLYGAYLSQAVQVVLFDPWEEHVRAIRREGLFLEEIDGSQRRFQIAATTEVAEVGEADLALIFVKSHQTSWAAEIASEVLNPEGIALTLQNGVGNREVLARALGDERAVQGVTAHGAMLLGPGRVRHAGKGPTHLALSPATEDKVREIAAIFEAAGIEVHVSQELESLIWGKLIINVGINALSAILRVPNGQLVEIAPAREIMRQAVQEAATVADALGIHLPYPDPVKRTEEVCQATAVNHSSMLRDVLRGSPTEVEVINVVILRQGQRIGIKTPVNSALVFLIRAIEKSYEVRV